MDPVNPYRPRISRETRLLLTTAFLAVAALWVLARVRFPDLPATPNPVPQVFSQLGGGPRYSDLASEIAEAYSRLEPSLVALGPTAAPSSEAGTPFPRAALRIRDDLAVTVLEAEWRSPVEAARRVVARDPVYGLAVLGIERRPGISTPAPWPARRPDQPRYLIATDVVSHRIALRPVFVGMLEPVTRPLWPRAVWLVPPRTELAPGSFVFTINSELVGLVVARHGELLILPGEVLLAETDRLLQVSGQPAPNFGLDVQALTPRLALATGAAGGVIVTWVERGGPASERLAVGDVIETVGGLPVTSPEHFEVGTSRLAEGEVVVLGVRRSGVLQEVQLTAPAAPAVTSPRALGLTARAVRAVGAEIVRVEPGSPAASAGLATGDVITRIGEVAAPSPSQVTRVFSAAREGAPLLVAVTRGARHFVTTIDK